MYSYFSVACVHEMSGENEDFSGGGICGVIAPSQNFLAVSVDVAGLNLRAVPSDVFHDVQDCLGLDCMGCLSGLGFTAPCACVGNVPGSSGGLGVIFGVCVYREDVGGFGVHG